MTEAALSAETSGGVRGLFELKPGRWVWGHAVRSALTIGGPFAVGVLLDDILLGLWIAMGTVMMSAGERIGTYRLNLRIIATAAPIGAAGYLLGYAADLPAVVLALVVGAVALVTGTTSGWGPGWSLGSMQALLVSSIAIGVPGIGPYWELSLWYLVGAALYAALLGVEMLCAPRVPERRLLAALLDALATLAERRAAPAAAETGPTPVELARREVVDAALAVRTSLIRDGSARMRTEATPIAEAADRTWSDILRTPDPESLQRTAADLRTLSAGVISGRELLASDLPGGTGPAAPDRIEWTAPTPRRRSTATPIDGAAIACCMVVAVLLARWIPENHAFWIPLTVALVTKYDLGSVFARAVLRIVGTALGVLIAMAAITFLDKGLPLVVVMTVLALVIPWGMTVSYLVQAFLLAPLILLLVDVIQPGGGSVDYAGQRVVDTVIGGAVVMVFGYLLWRRAHRRLFARRAAAAIRTTVDLIEPPGSSATATDPAAARLSALAAWAGIRRDATAMTVEPPPNGRAAQQWLPTITLAERVIDRSVSGPLRGSTDAVRNVAATYDGPAGAQAVLDPAVPARQWLALLR